MRRLRIAAVLGALAAAAAVAGCGDATRPADRGPVSTAPELTPAFDSRIQDYVTRCDPAEPVRFHVAAPRGATIGVDGAPPRAGRFDASVKLAPGQGTEFVVRSGTRSRTYHVRCLPGDFPRWNFVRLRHPEAQWYLFAPQSGQERPESHFVIFFDGRGTPIWWDQRPTTPFNSFLLPNGNLVWGRWFGDPFAVRPQSAWEVHRLDGTLVRTLRTVGSPTDMHNMKELPNGHFLLMTYRIRRNFDLSRYGAGEDPRAADRTIADGEIQEIDRSGRVVWHWDALDHIHIDENAGSWRHTYRTIPGGARAFDWLHLNSIDPDGHGGLVISARHVDAVYRIDKRTGDITWKLGGTRRPESLTVSGDTSFDGTFSGQHDASVLPDGTVTVYDNHAPRKPRVVRFAIDPKARTARLMEEVRDPSLVWSAAEGTATRLRAGDWVVSWGANPVLSELTSRSRLVWRMRLAAGQSYGIQPIPYGTVPAARLRRAMDRMNPRS